jgi:hypothetical protein
MRGSEIILFFSQKPTLQECQSTFPDAEEVRSNLYTSILHIVALTYQGTEAVPIIKWLLGPPHSIPLEKTCTRDNGTPLMLAIHRGNFIMASALIVCGAGVNVHVQIRSFHYYLGNRGLVWEQWAPLDYILHDSKSPSLRKKVLFLLDHGANACSRYQIPDYGQEFLVKRKRLFRACIIVLGMRFRPPHPFVDRWLLPIIAQYMWSHRFDDEK